MRPNLYLVGAPKAGTSALANFLAQHPDICMCKIKEPNYHNTDMELPRPKSEAEYLSLFENRNDAPYLCDGSILYMYSKVAAKSIQEYSPDAKILIMLRNPIDAVLSWHGQMVYTGNEPETDFDEALELELSRKQGECLPVIGMASKCPQVLFYRDVMSYCDQIYRFTRLFPSNNIKIIIFDDFRKNAQASFLEVVDFLGIDRDFKPRFGEVNVKKERTNPGLHRLLKKYFAEISKKTLPLSIRHRLIRVVDKLTSRETGPVKLSSQARAELRTYYRDEIDKLGGMLNRDLSHWYE